MTKTANDGPISPNINVTNAHDLVNRTKISFYSFWSINDKLDITTLKYQLDELKTAGLSGVIFHPRNYPNEPTYLSDEYMNIVSEIILYAKSLGMIFWIYDENGWPSGTAGGEVMKCNPELHCQWIELIKDEEFNMTKENCIRSFKRKNDEIFPADHEEGQLYHLIVKSKPAVDSLDPKACAYFIEITHERYKAGLAADAFQYVKGFFSDEVAFLDGYNVSIQYGGIPWVDSLFKQYKERYKEDLISKLPLLFINDKGYETVRVQFWELLTDSINDGFYKPIKNWCKTNGKEFTAHLKGEENPFFQIGYSGSCFQVLKNVTVPAIDALERYPGNNYYTRIAHSIAAQFGNGECLAEAMGGAGWGIKPEHLENYVLWLTSHGIYHIVLHLNQLRLNSKAIHDWPPSMPCHLTWREAFPKVLERVQEKASRQPDLTKAAELLIVTPTRGVMAEFEPHLAMQINCHNGSNIPDTAGGVINRKFLQMVEECHEAGIHYELTDERILEEYGRIEREYLLIGKRSYPKILIAEGCIWTEKGEKLLSRSEESGILLLDPQTWKGALVHKNNTRIDPKTAEDRLFCIKQTPWKAEMTEENLLVLEFTETKEGTYISSIDMEQEEKLGNLEVVCMDSTEEARLDGKLLMGRHTQNGSAFKIPSQYLVSGSKHLVEISSDSWDDKNPVAFLKGKFAVVSRTPYIEKNEDETTTMGPFVAKPVSTIECNNFVEAGLPFFHKHLKLSKKIMLDIDLNDFSLRLTGVKADAARVYMNGQELGWCWGPKWTVNHPAALSIGEHVITVELFPNTFNVYGPHHHIDGDLHLTTPAQYEGVRNFADRPDAPENTKSSEWNFVKFYIKGEVQFIC